MSQEYIEIRGARENNLKNVSLRIPKRQITIFTGVSGSGKSSIVFDTIASEARRQLNETFSTFVRNFLPRYAQPDADAIENLSMAIVVDQKHLGGGSHSTVGTITDIYSVLRLLVFAGRAALCRQSSDCLFVQRSAGHVSRLQRHGSQDRCGSVALSGYVQITQRGRHSVPGICRRQLGLEYFNPVGSVRYGQKTG